MTFTNCIKDNEMFYAILLSELEPLPFSITSSLQVIMNFEVQGTGFAHCSIVQQSFFHIFRIVFLFHVLIIVCLKSVERKGTIRLIKYIL